ncbi:MAG TPA: alpha/beta hydrolase [Spirochaetota bacterium]|nr:alpha/beta hydrolase [Spirochaetota bacterium]HOM37859.1 alpha/beta hydrolase [Spirochaetota bacterium]HPQ48663.1 alpha/beta hydrolase [Spirochaetota bacterium]
MVFTSFDSCKIYFNVFERDSEENILILHGWTANSSFYYFLKRYIDYANLVLWDARSHGKSTLDKDATIEKIARDLRCLLEVIGDKKLTIMGHSMGALTIFEYISQFGVDGIDKIVIIDQSPKLITDSEWGLGLYGNFSYQMNQSLIKEFEEDLSLGLIKLSYAYGINPEYNKMYKDNFDYLYSNRRIFQDEQSLGLINIWKSFSVKDYRGILEKIDIPVLLIYGAKSQFYKVGTGLYLKSKIKKSKLFIFENGDHSPFLSDPESFSGHVYNFIKGEGPFLDKNIYGRV